MKIFKFLMVALVAMVGLNSCSEDCDHEFYETDYSKALVGTWTLMNEGFAEAWVVKADGSVEVTGVLDGEYYETKGTVKVKNNKMSYKFDNGDQFEGILEIIPGKCFSLAYESDYQFEDRVTYQYCENDLSDEIVGMWVCNATPSAEENDMLIMTYNADGTTSFSGYFYEADDFGANMEASYKVIGDLLIHKQPDIALEMGLVQYSAIKLVYTPNATSLGDVMSLKAYAKVGENNVETNTSWLRIKQHLNLAGKKYDYSDIYVTNVKGLDKDIPFHPEYTFNFAKMDGTLIDKILKSILFSIEFPDANTFKYSCSYPNPNTSLDAPMVVNGNKVTVKMSERNPAYRDIDFYMFQDADDCQLHMYLPTNSFINFYGNMQVIMMEQLGQIDTTDAAAVKAVYDSLDEAVETINMSFVMKARN